VACTPFPFRLRTRTAAVVVECGGAAVRRVAGLNVRRTLTSQSQPNPTQTPTAEKGRDDTQRSRTGLRLDSQSQPRLATAAAAAHAAPANPVARESEVGSCRLREVRSCGQCEPVRPMERDCTVGRRCPSTRCLGSDGWVPPRAHECAHLGRSSACVTALRGATTPTACSPNHALPPQPNPVAQVEPSRCSPV
jgi:hypothetical protein